MQFKAATDRAMELGVRVREIAEALDVSDGSIKAARLPKDSPSYRDPPSGWAAGLRRLCRGRSEALDQLAEELEARPQ